MEVTREGYFSGARGVARGALLSGMGIAVSAAAVAVAAFAAAYARDLPFVSPSLLKKVAAVSATVGIIAGGSSAFLSGIIANTAIGFDKD